MKRLILFIFCFSITSHADVDYSAWARNEVLTAWHWTEQAQSIERDLSFGTKRLEPIKLYPGWTLSKTRKDGRALQISVDTKQDIGDGKFWISSGTIDYNYTLFGNLSSIATPSTFTMKIVDSAGKVLKQMIESTSVSHLTIKSDRISGVSRWVTYLDKFHGDIMRMYVHSGQFHAKIENKRFKEFRIDGSSYFVENTEAGSYMFFVPKNKSFITFDRKCGRAMTVDLPFIYRSKDTKTGQSVERKGILNQTSEYLNLKFEDGELLVAPIPPC